MYDADSKAQIVSDVLHDLPGWFGLPDSAKEYVEHSKKLSLWVAERNNETVGFITLTNTSIDTDEGKYKEYDQTIGFYKKMGFSKFKVFPALWDEWNQRLVMCKCLDRKEK